MGRGYIPGTSYGEALASHFDPGSAVEHMKQVHEWMQKDAMDLQNRREKGFDAAYDLQVWEPFPGNNPTVTNVVMQNLTFGTFGSGAGAGPNTLSAQLAARLVAEVRKYQKVT